MSDTAIETLFKSQASAVIPHFLPPSRAEGDGFLAIEGLKRLEGMCLVELENPGTISVESFKHELGRLLPHIKREVGTPDTLALSDGTQSTASPLTVPVMSAEEATLEVFKRALGTAKAIIETPDDPKHMAEKKVALAAAKGAGYTIGGSR